MTPVNIGSFGIWTFAFDQLPAARGQELAHEVEALGYGAVWIPEAVGKDPLVHSALLLSGPTPLTVAPGIANNPVWLWEAVAVYEAGQLVPPSSLPSLVAGRFPTLAELSSRSSSPSIYDVGYTLTEFIVARWGLDGLRRLIRSLGDLSTLGHTTASFEAEWRAFVTARYL